MSTMNKATLKSVCFLSIVFLFVMVLGCVDEEQRSERVTVAAASSLARARGCGVKDADITAVKLGDPIDITVTHAMEEYGDARDANDKVDERLKENLARVGPALSQPKLKPFLEAFETIGTVKG